MYYRLLRRVSVTRVTYFNVISTTGTRCAPPRRRDSEIGSDRRPSTSVYRKFIRFYRHVTASLALKRTDSHWRGTVAVVARAHARAPRSRMKVIRYCVNNGSTCAINGARGETVKKAGKGLADKCSFIGQRYARKNVIAPAPRWNVRGLAIFGRNTSCARSRQSHRERAPSKGSARRIYNRVFQLRVFYLSKRRVLFFTYYSIFIHPLMVSIRFGSFVMV